ncbi:hypothetical protein CY34DRAFT_260675 [Suillus luteus UH-Slu-Lm8-n1]|uniref:Uncharacterized protein n=1 Tax=Suillus luteus UH-Slu-Lm8-n1 TaxID=930992 RepID=A0A0D0AFQ9_9AGAM|nr:hypothetical protein CY34DRAFT_260675 [Suillus luteus UH-Slu-Lm8-n1]
MIVTSYICDSLAFVVLIEASTGIVWYNINIELANLCIEGLTVIYTILTANHLLVVRNQMKQISPNMIGKYRAPHEEDDVYHQELNFRKRSRLPSSEFTKRWNCIWGKRTMDPSVRVMVTNVDYERSEEERERACAVRLTSFMTDGKHGDENQRKFHSSLRTR